MTYRQMDDMEAWDVKGNTPLYKASKQGDLPLVVELLGAGADPNANSIWGYAPLHIASCNRNWTIMIVLLEYGADPNVRDSEGFTTLHRAIRNGRADFAVVEELLMRGADVDAKDDYDSTPLHLASERVNSHAVVELLLGARADPNAKDTTGRTPLHLVCIYSEPAEELVKVLKALLEKGADIHAADNRGQLPIDLTLRVENAAAVKCLLQHHYSNLCDEESRLLLHAFLRDATSDDNPAPPLRVALDEEVLDTNDLLEIIVFLVNQNPQLVSARDRDGSVPLHVACSTSAPLEIARYLVEYAPGALRVARTTDGSYPLHVALEHCASSVVIDLLLHNQDPDTTKLINNAGETPLHVA
jgi:ankyrin repeat protein